MFLPVPGHPDKVYNTDFPSSWFPASALKGGPNGTIDFGNQGNTPSGVTKFLGALPMVALGGLGVSALAGALGGGAAGAADAASGGAAAGGGATGAAGAVPALLPSAVPSVGGMTAGATGAASGGFWGPMLSKIGGSLSAINSGAAAGRVAEANANIAQTNAGANLARVGLEKQQVGNDLQQQDYQNQVRGSLLQGLKDFTVTPPAGVNMGTISGGLRPSAIGDAGTIGKGMYDTATSDLTAGKGQTGLTGLSGLTLPTLPPLPSPNAAQSALGIAAPALSLAPSFLDILKKYQTPQAQAA